MESKLFKKLFSMLIVVAMVLSMCPTIVFAEGEETLPEGYCPECKVVHEWVTFDAATHLDENRYLTPGYYKLGANVTLTATNSYQADGTTRDPSVSTADIKIAAGTKVCLDLAGYDIAVASYKADTSSAVGRYSRVITNEGTLSILDSVGGGEIKNGRIGSRVPSSYGNGGNILNTGTFNLYSGTITGGVAYARVYNAGALGGNIANEAGSVFNMYGGTVSNGQTYSSSFNYDADSKNAHQGGGNIYSAGEVNIFGGTISGGKVDGSYSRSSTGSYGFYSKGGNIFMHTGTFNMTGGTITGGKITRTFTFKNDTNNAKASAYCYGGNLYAINTDVAISNATITDGSITPTVKGESNTTSTYAAAAYAYGGNIYINGDDAKTKVTITDSTISGGVANAAVDYADTTVTDNHGKGLYVNNIGGNIYLTEVARTTIDGNTVISGGSCAGSTATDDKTHQGYGGNIHSNRLIDIKGNTQILNGVANDNPGGNLYLGNYSNCTISENAKVVGGIGNGNSGGGNIYITGAKSTLNIQDNAEVSGGSARGGGNIYANSDAKVYITGGTIKDGISTWDQNETYWAGGNLLAFNGASATITGGTISGGTANRFFHSIGTRGNAKLNVLGGQILGTDAENDLPLIGELSPSSGNGVFVYNGTVAEDPTDFLAPCACYEMGASGEYKVWHVGADANLTSCTADNCAYEANTKAVDPDNTPDAADKHEYDENGYCTICGIQAVVRVDYTDGTVEHYSSIIPALQAANGTGATVTALRDTSTKWYTYFETYDTRLHNVTLATENGAQMYDTSVNSGQKVYMEDVTFAPGIDYKMTGYLYAYGDVNIYGTAWINMMTVFGVVNVYGDQGATLTTNRNTWIDRTGSAINVYGKGDGTVVWNANILDTGSYSLTIENAGKFYLENAAASFAGIDLDVEGSGTLEMVNSSIEIRNAASSFTGDHSMTVYGQGQVLLKGESAITMVGTLDVGENAKVELSADSTITTTSADLKNVGVVVADGFDGCVWYDAETGVYSAKAHDADDATCTEDGKCVNCNAVVNPATGHSLTKTEAKPDTCTEAGNSAYWTCSVCGKFFSDAEGVTEIQENDWVIDEITDHAWDAWENHNADQHKQVCANDPSHVTYGDHDWQVTGSTAGDCQTAGTTSYECSVCKATKTVDGAMGSHSLTKTEAKPDTCTEAGNSAYWTCSICGKYFSDAEGVTEIQENDWVIDEITDHNYSYTSNGDGTHNGVCANNCGIADNGTCDEAGTDGTCSKCGYVATTYVAEVNGTQYETLAEAVEAVKNGGTITLLDDIETSESYTIAKGVSVTLNLNGKTITVTDEKVEQNANGNYALFWNYGNLTVTGNGAIELTATTDRGWNALSAIFYTREGGELTIENGTFTHKGGSDMAFVVDTYGNTTTNIEGGNLHSTYTAIRVRMDAGYTAVLNVSDGKLSGDTSAVWAQASSGTAAKPAAGQINITGGELDVVNTSRSSGSNCMTTVSGGTVGTIKAEVGELTVKGGTVTTTTILTVDGNAADYVVTDEGVYAQAVAQIGSTKYATLQEAMDAAVDGDTITVLADITYTKDNGYVNGTWVEGLVYTGDKSFTVDFGGHTITDNGDINDYLIYLKNQGEKDNEITFQNGKIIVKSDRTNTVWAAVTVGAASATHKTTLNLNGMEIVNNNPNNESNLVVRVRNGSVVNLNNGTVVTSDGASYGASAETGSTLNVNSGAKVVQTNSGTTSGNLVYTAIGGNGTINIYDGAVIESDKYGIHNMTSGNAVINIYGGTITAPVTVHASTNGGTGETATVTITGGTFNGTLETTNNDSKIVVSGGSFDAPVDEKFCAEGFIPKDNGDGTFGVKVGSYVAEVNGTKYTSIADALEAADDGDTVILLADVTLDTEVTLTDMSLTITGDYTLDANDKLTLAGTVSLNAPKLTGDVKAAANAVIKDTNIGGYLYLNASDSNLTFQGDNKVDGFSASYYNNVITIGAGAYLEITGSNRLTIGWGNTFNITGTITDAKTADKSAIKPSLKVAAGITVNGSSAKTTLNVTNAYIVFSSTCGTNKNAYGGFVISFTNSIADLSMFKQQYAIGTYDVDFVDSVINVAMNLTFQSANAVVDVDNSQITVGASFGNAGTFTLKNGSVMNVSDMVNTTENGTNSGLTIVDNATLNATGTSIFKGYSTGVLKVVNGGTATINKITDATVSVDVDSTVISNSIDSTNTIKVDVADFDEAVTVIEADLSGYTGQIALDNNNGTIIYEANANGLTVKKAVASVNGVAYESLQAAIDAAVTANGGIVKVLGNITVDETVVVSKATNMQVWLNLNGFTVTGEGNADPVIKNNGFMMITGGTVKSTVSGGTAIESTNMLTTFTGAVFDAGNDGYALVSTGSMCSVSGTFIGKISIDMEKHLSASYGTPIKDGLFSEAPAAEHIGATKVAVLNADGMYELADAVASVGNVGYATLTEAIEAAENGDTVKLLADITVSEVIMISNAVTLDGNDHTITSSANRVIRVAANATVNDLKMVSTAVRVGTSDIRGISVDNVSGITLTLNNCSVDFTDASASDWSYAVNQSGENSNGNTITINGGTYEGANVVNIWGTNHTVNIDGATLTSLYALNDLFCGVCVKTNAASTADITVKNSTFNGTHAVALDVADNTVAKENNTDNTKRYVAKVGSDYFYTLAEAVAAANDGDTVKLLTSVTINELIKIEEAITLDLNGKKVTATSKKAFEVYANATIMNGTIEAANRCVDTRKAVELTLTDVNLIADKYTTHGNPQPLTIGGSENGTKVNMTNVNISAAAGYGIITFVKTQLNATGCTISGYNALYVKPGSEESVFNFNDCDLTGSTTSNDVEGNSFSTIAVRADDVTVNVDADSTVSATGNYCWAISLDSKFTGESGITGANITVAGTINGKVLDSADVDNNTITVKAEYAAQLQNAGYGAVIANGMATAAVAVASVNGTYYATLAEALAADGEVKLVADIDATASGVIVAAGETIDLNGKKLTADIIGVTIKMNGGTFATSDYLMVGATEGKYTSTDAVFTIAPNATMDMTIVSGTITLNETLWYTMEGQTLTIAEAATFVIPEGKTLYVNGSNVVVNGTAANFGTLILANGAHVKGDIAGTFQMAGGTYETSKYVMIGAADGKYLSTDAIFTIVPNATMDMTIVSGTITLNDPDWWTFAGQTLTIAEAAKFVVPAGKNINVQSTVIVDGTVQIDGTVTLYNADATIKAVEGLENIVANPAAGDTVIYENGVYKVHDHSYSAVVTAPTCTEKGYTTYTCTCGDSYVADYVDETGHNHVGVYTDPTNTENGYWTYTCHCGDSYVVVDEGTMLHYAVNEQTGESYGDLQAALNAAAKGETVKLLKDATAEDIYVGAGKTLDLNGNKLTITGSISASFTTTHIVDSSKGQGLLVVDGADVALNSKNEQLPLWTAEGVKFVTVTYAQALDFKDNTGAANENVAYYRFAFEEKAAKTVLDNVLANGTDGTGVVIRIKADYVTADGVKGAQYFEYTSEMVKKYVNDGNGWDANMFTLYLSNVATLESLAFSAEIVSTATNGSNVVIGSTPISD